ncbi:hypothetical protein HHL28_16960 [Aerophototrophica crusticola]|uniref:Uncharacterized protein n=1 Tax=Aerophototrophica crusticola TaxID=1709002 RepID=A0A858RB15_9PROT|nr:hypothetical protein HHL28_16960 [Rhodospirillaceae bacterium B3]
MVEIGGNGPRRGVSPWRLVGWGGAAALLLLPAVAMRFTTKVDWGPEDFITFGVMLAVAGGALEVAVRMSGNWAYRAGAGVAVATGFLLLWANLAVGVIGSEDNPANLMFHGVLLVGIIGAILARFRPRGMSLAVAAMALAQLLAFVVGVVAGWGETPVVTVVFAGLWLTSAWLFRKAAREEG